MRRTNSNSSYQIDLDGGNLRVLFFGSASNIYLFRQFTHNFSASTDYHVVVTKTGTSIEVYVDKVSKTLTNLDSGSYVAMISVSSDLVIGAKSFPSFDSVFDGKIKRSGVWSGVLSQLAVDDLYETEITNNSNVL